VLGGEQDKKLRSLSMVAVGGTEKSCLITTNQLTYYLPPLLWFAVFYEIGRAMRGVSGTLYSQSAIARLNSFPRVDSAESLPP